jgi:hypothetical protein
MTRILALQKLKVSIRMFGRVGSVDSAANGTSGPGRSCECPHSNN